MFEMKAKTPQDLCVAVYRLIEENLNILEDENQTPMDPLESYVVYKREPVGSNKFLNMRDLLRQGYGDCEDLAAWLIAYYLYLGFTARPVARPTGPRLYHILLEVYLKGKWYEVDPSKMKGM